MSHSEDKISINAKIRMKGYGRGRTALLRVELQFISRGNSEYTSCNISQKIQRKEANRTEPYSSPVGGGNARSSLPAA